MKINQTIVGIVAEYNPYHNGHAWQLQQLKKRLPDAQVVAVMSGNFVQRGQPALLDKWLRAKIAVENGIDLVIELPFSFACRSAEHFARGSIGIMQSLGVVEHLVFGAECSDLEMLNNIAQASMQPQTIANMKENMKAGMSYPRALQSSLAVAGIDNKSINAPNNILAIEYLKQLSRLNSNIKPQLVVRHIAGYKDPEIAGCVASATAIRSTIQRSSISKEVIAALPASTAANLQLALAADNIILENNQALSLLTLYKIRNSTAEYLQTVTDVSEGLEHKIIVNARKATNLPNLVDSLVNSRYPQSRINRILLQAVVGMHKAEQPTYIRPLAFNKQGRQILTKIKAKSSLPLITKLGKDFASLPENLKTCPVLTTEIAASNLYQLLYPVAHMHQADYLNSPQYINI